MDIKDTVHAFCSAGEGLTKSMISVEWSEDYNMKHHPALHQLIEEQWTLKSHNSIRLFNASKFRLHKVEVTAPSFGHNIKFLLGKTSYKDFIGTHYAPFGEQLVEDGRRDYSDSQAYLSNPIGVGGILETKDGDLVFMRRSNICAEMPGLLDRPGGHPEPSVVTSEGNQSPELVQSTEVIDEIYNSVLKEIRDEINVAFEFLSYPLLLGISYNPETFKRPSFEFYVRCCLPTAEVRELYSKQTHAEREESTDLIFIPISDALDGDKLQESQFYSELTHAAQSAIYLLQIFYSK